MKRETGIRVVVPWRPVLAACLGLVLSACGGSGSTEPSAARAIDPTQDSQAVADAHHRMIDAYQRGDVQDFVLSLDKSGDLLIFHPQQQDRWVGVDEVQRWVDLMFARLGESKWSDVHLDVKVEGDVAWLTSHVVIESSSLQVPFTGRGTEIWVRRGDTWRLVHAHWSANPEF